MVKSNDLGPLVGDGKFFKHVSSRMAYALPIGHQLGLRGDSHAASTRPGSFNIFTADYVTNERSKGFLGYNAMMGNERMILAGERVALGVLPTCAMIMDSTIYRSQGSEELFFKDSTDCEDAEFTSYARLNEVACSMGQSAFMDTIPEPADDVLNPAVKLPINACVGGDGFAAFPAFDLYASRIDACRVSDEPNSWPMIHLANSANMTDPLVVAYEPSGVVLPETGSCQDWIVWMTPEADIPANSFMYMKMEVLTANK